MRDINPQSSRQIGLRRLWLVVSIIWLAGTIAVVFDHHNAFMLFLLAGALPVAALYALIAGINWVIEGFRSNR
jgi:Na+/melibiose symporter-like transporter